MPAVSDFANSRRPYTKAGRGPNASRLRERAILPGASAVAVIAPFVVLSAFGGYSAAGCYLSDGRCSRVETNSILSSSAHGPC